MLRRTEACRLRPPANLTPRARTAPISSSSPEQTSPIGHVHPSLFSPTEARPTDAWYSRIVASQNPNCSSARYLLVENDMRGAGLGMVAKLLVPALLLAVRDRRVMIEVPPRNRSRSLWCDRPPHSLACFVVPWSHCEVPTIEGSVKPGLILAGQNNAFAWPLTAAKVHLPLSYMLFSRLLWMGRGAWVDITLQRVVLSLLFRPRAWVRAIGQCVLRRARLSEHNFTAVFVRDSVEKAEELHRPLPPLAVYARLAEAVERHQRPTGPKLYLQTSSARSVDFFREFCANSSLPLAYTESERADHDLWGRRSQSGRQDSWQNGEMEQGTIAAVNLYAASKASAFVSLSASMWTSLQVAALLASSGDVHGVAAVSWIEVKCRGSPLEIRIAARVSDGLNSRVLASIVRRERELKCRVIASKDDECGGGASRANSPTAGRGTGSARCGLAASWSPPTRGRAPRRRP
mmetsp:Transcript_40258/g.117281  ORF Transcript_40258/g.117281 Transcript_40258/m.117281 type:complete len:462 (+) Transcript_40258:55-1440(+)